MRLEFREYTLHTDSLVSVIIPAFNAARYLPDTLDSVLAQNLPLDVIVVDDGSDDGTRDVLERYAGRIRVTCQERQGAGAARNRGVAIASGEYLAFLDADDLWPAARLGRALAWLHGHEAVDMVFGHAEEFYSPDLTPEEQQRLVKRDGTRPFYSACTMVVRQPSFSRTGGFTASWKAGEFVDWYLRAADQGLRAEMLDDLVLRRRVHRGHLGKRTDAASQDYVRIVRHSLERRRAAARANAAHA